MQMTREPLASVRLAAGVLGFIKMAQVYNDIK